VGGTEYSMYRPIPHTAVKSAVEVNASCHQPEDVFNCLFNLSQLCSFIYFVKKE